MCKAWLMMAACVLAAGAIGGFVGTGSSTEQEHMRVRGASSRSAERPGGGALCGRAGGFEPVREICQALRPELRPPQYLYRVRDETFPSLRI